LENRDAIRTDPDLNRKTGRYKSVADIFLSVANDVFRRPDRRSVTQVAEQFVKIKRTGGQPIGWSSERTPYMIEPQNTLASRNHSAVIFVGPSQAGKTEGLILNYIAYSAIQDPLDMILYCPSIQSARDFSVRRVDRMNNNSPELSRRLIRNRESDTVYRKIYTSGMILNLSWPTVTEMAGKPVGRIMLTDYDRMSDDIGGEGSPFDLAYMRTTTYASLRMTVAESSPSRPVEEPRWIAGSAHEAPPCKGILGLYNRGDRRRWYWPCARCGEYFEGRWEHLQWDAAGTPLECAETVRMVCPVCNGNIWPADRVVMQEYGLWLADGQSLDQAGFVVGKGPHTDIASYWLNGVAAGFQTWPEIVTKFINADREYSQTQSEQSLQQFYNNVLGQPYRSKVDDLLRLPEVLHARAEPLGEWVVPEWVRLLVASVDVQKNLFVVQIHGIGPGTPFDVAVIDRFQIRKSRRLDHDGESEWVRPATFAEDWDLLIDEVMLRTYPLADGSGRVMQIKLTLCDSGGFNLHRGEGVTSQAYGFQRSLRERGYAGRFHLVKGDGRPAAPRSWIDFPDARNKDKLSAARGDVPVLFLNSNVMKDTLSARLDTTEAGHGKIHFADWLPIWFYKELCAETRTEKGWINRSGGRNEAWDLLYYTLGACASRLLQIEKIDWDHPPSWAATWDKNPLVVKSGDKELLINDEPIVYDFTKLGKALA
jgi:phage terminase large subunit GpA-like protein